MTATVFAAMFPSPAGGAGQSLPFAVGHVMHVLLVAGVGLSAGLTARSRAVERGALDRMTRIAELAQQALVHPLPAHLDGLNLVTHSRSATSGIALCGDLYDAAVTPTGPRLIVGDVKGHGLAMARISTSVLAAFRQAAAGEPDLVRLACILDERVSAELGEEDFVTVLLADFKPDEVLLVNCGHPPPLRVGRRMDLLEPPSPSPPLGLSPEPSPQRIGLSSTQRLLLYTDGLTEARDAAGTMFSLDEQVHAALSAASPEQALAELLGLLDVHAPGGVQDDLTLILVQPDPTPHAAPVHHMRDGTEVLPPSRWQ
ncbi:PP2C family protein-serine/threonine phosphatase [Streptomyces longispororuber]|uniref:PP2C family protein-serine/threonine phosphatase n=1 Tax=Streptomyces longispororuber TaxID=68230 RepID=UPI00210DA11F|nr:PP2C family protein-serine/threonine phosphatase [Streptomyces longispororuber]MCQ4213141.1 serine/threonine-protein phosphatase [Streptomyces longispororuber]